VLQSWQLPLSTFCFVLTASYIYHTSSEIRVLFKIINDVEKLHSYMNVVLLLVQRHFSMNKMYMDIILQVIFKL
jgi:hypothetical protein